MNRKLGLTIFLFIALIGVSNVLAAEISVGVKKGDYIEYQVAFTGTPSAGHDVNWAMMEIKEVQGESVSVELTSTHANGTQEKFVANFNLQTGQLGDDLIIPANLDVGDVFFDQNVGNITISGVEERTYAGAKRTVVHATTPETTYYWHKATGILVEGESTFPDYTISTIADKTNMWQPKLLGLDPTVFYAFVGATVVIVVALAFLIAKRKK